MSFYLEIAIDTPLRRVFDYRAPPGITVDALRPGARVADPFGRRRAVGILLKIKPTTQVPDAKLKTASEILDVLGDFTKQWSAFTDKMDALGRGLNTVTKAFDDLSGTRNRALTRQMDRIDDLRRTHTIVELDDDAPMRAVTA